jgi:hypothetical protein
VSIVARRLLKVVPVIRGLCAAVETAGYGPFLQPRRVRLIGFSICRAVAQMICFGAAMLWCRQFTLG